MDKINIFQQQNIFSLNNYYCVKNGKVFSYTNSKNKKYISIKGTKVNENYLIIPNNKYNKINYMANTYFISGIFYANKKSWIKLIFTLSHSNSISFEINFKYPLQQINIIKSNNKKYLIDIPIEIHNEKEDKTITFNPREFISCNNIFQHDSKFNLDKHNIILKRIELFPYLELFGIYIDKEINYRDIYLKETQLNKDKLLQQQKLIVPSLNLNNTNTNTNNLLLSNVSRRIIIQSNETIDEENDKENEHSSLSMTDNILNLPPSSHRRNQTQISSINNSLMGQGFSANSNNFNLNIPPLLNPIMNTTLRSSSKSLSAITSGMQLTNMPITTRTYQDGKDNQYDGLYCLDKVIDFTPQCCKIILYDEHQKIFYYVVNNKLIKVKGNKQYTVYQGKDIINNMISTNKSKYIFLSHTSELVLLENNSNINKSSDGNMQNQEHVAKTFKIKIKHIKHMNIDISSKYLLLTGININNNEDTICIYDIEQITNETNIQNEYDIKLYITQISPYHINQMKFDINDTNTLVSCGNRNIRVWNRTMNNCLIGKNIGIIPSLRNNNFNFIEYDYLNINYIYCVFSNKMLYINYMTLSIEKQFELDIYDITTFTSNTNYLLIGTCDGRIRMWNSNINLGYSNDKSSYILEAISFNDKSEICYALIINNDKILYGALDGSLYIVNVNNKQVKRVMVKINTSFKKIIYINSDNKIIGVITSKGNVGVYKVINNEGFYTLEEVFTYDNSTFNYNSECIVYINKTLIVGFSNGVVKTFKQVDNNVNECVGFVYVKDYIVFKCMKYMKYVSTFSPRNKTNKHLSLGSSSLSSLTSFSSSMTVRKHHKQKSQMSQTSVFTNTFLTSFPIIDIQPHNNDKHIIVKNSNNDIAIVDIKNEFEVIYQILSKNNNNNTYNNVLLAASKLFSVFAVYDKQTNDNIILIYNTDILSIANKIIIDNSDNTIVNENINTINNIILPHKNVLCVLINNNKFNFYSICKKGGELLRSVFNINSNHNDKLITSLHSSLNYKYIFTISKEENLINIWNGKICYSNQEHPLIETLKLNEKNINDIIIDDRSGNLIIYIKQGNSLIFYKFNGEMIYNDAEIEKEFELLGQEEYVENKVQNNIKKLYVNTNKKGKLYVSKKENEINKENIEKEELSRKNDSDVNNPNEELLKFNREEEMLKEENMKFKEIIDFEKDNEINRDYKKAQWISIEEYLINNSVLVPPSISESLDLSGLDTAQRIEKTNKDLKDCLQLTIGNIYQPERNQNKRYIYSLLIIFHYVYRTYKELDPNYSNDNKQCYYLSTPTTFMQTIVMDSHHNYYAYISNNKIIIEFLKEKRTQKILQNTLDRLSVSNFKQKLITLFAIYI